MHKLIMGNKLFIVKYRKKIRGSSKTSSKLRLKFSSEPIRCKNLENIIKYLDEMNVNKIDTLTDVFVSLYTINKILRIHSTFKLVNN